MKKNIALSLNTGGGMTRLRPVNGESSHAYAIEGIRGLRFDRGPFSCPFVSCTLSTRTSTPLTITAI